MTVAALQVVDLHARYAHVQVLNGVSLYAMAGEVVVILGRNDSGRRATLCAIIGQVETRQGSIRIIGKETIHNDCDDITHLGLSFVPTHGGIYPNLTCEENLLLPMVEGDTLGGAMSLTQIYELCPDLNTLRQTLGARLSHAEQRMLAIARMLRTGANVLLMDDITDGLAPVMTQAFLNIILNLKRLGYTIVMGEPNIEFCAQLADRFYVMQDGQVTDTFTQHELAARQETLHALLADTYESY